MAPRKQQSVLFPLLMVAAGMVLIIGSVVWALNSAPPAVANDEPGLRTQPVMAGLPTQGALRIPYPEIARVSLADAKAAFDNQQAIFIDTRGSDFYALEHIPGAIDLPISDVMQRLGELDKNAWLIPYCT